MAATLDSSLQTSTGTQTRTLSASSPSCAAPGYAGNKCFCDTCNDATADACSVDAECPLSCGNAGVCGGKRCLGGGNNVATLVKVSSGSDFTLTALNGRNAIALNSVSSNTSPEAANDTFLVTLGSGRFNSVVMVNCTDGSDGTLEISNGGEDGVLVGALNSFAHQSDVTTFRFRAGDLRNNKV